MLRAVALALRAPSRRLLRFHLLDSARQPLLEGGDKNNLFNTKPDPHKAATEPKSEKTNCRGGL
jgi:hypothetical protein